ncbi:hypothetical protein J6590_064728 [Homalodisca vitripennis]|nr:hypothetical protein J6590_064728 [Homalodisca vitripennis]
MEGKALTYLRSLIDGWLPCDRRGYPWGTELQAAGAADRQTNRRTTHFPLPT